LKRLALPYVKCFEVPEKALYKCNILLLLLCWLAMAITTTISFGFLLIIFICSFIHLLEGDRGLSGWSLKNESELCFLLNLTKKAYTT